MPVADLLPWAAVLVLCWLGYLLVRQNGRLLLRLEAMEATLQHVHQHVVPQVPEGLPAGSEAPSFDLPSLAGERMTLEAFRGKRLWLVFFGPGCGYCSQMAPAVAALPHDGADGHPVPIIVAQGDVDENRELWLDKYGIHAPILLDVTMETYLKYRAAGTPSGYLIDEQGRIASPLTVGADGLLALARTADFVTDGKGGGPTMVAPGGQDGGRADGDDGDAAARPTRELRLPVPGVPTEGIGVGDIVQRMTSAVGIKTCVKCEQRRQAWNRWVIKGFTPTASSRG
jgi:peroxiredoxin